MGYEIIHIYGKQYAFSYQNKYLFYFNNFMLSLIIATQNYNKAETYDFAVLERDLNLDEDNTFVFLDLNEVYRGIRTCDNESDMSDVIVDLIEIDNVISHSE